MIKIYIYLPTATLNLCKPVTKVVIHLKSYCIATLEAVLKWLNLQLWITSTDFFLHFFCSIFREYFSSQRELRVDYIDTRWELQFMKYLLIVNQNLDWFINSCTNFNNLTFCFNEVNFALVLNWHLSITRWDSSHCGNF